MTPSTKERILQAAYRLFYREGFARVSVDAIAEQAKLTKRTVYYHFKSKDEVVAATLDNLHRNLMPQFQHWAGSEEISAEQVVENLFFALEKWAETEGWLGSGFSRVAAELADMPGHPARRSASVHKADVENWLAGQLNDRKVPHATELACQIMVLIEGGMGLALIHGDTQYISSAGRAASRLLEQDRAR